MVCAVIPVYKELPSGSELKSWTQCLSILGDHPLNIVYPDGLNLEQYFKKAKELRVNLNSVPLDKHYFESTNAYSKLLVSRLFYELFASYKYILIYQLDAWVFSDQLEKWCLEGYDYIGAPWLFNSAKAWCEREGIREFLPFWKRHRFYWKVKFYKRYIVGNGGFSLRKVSSCISAIEHFEKSNIEFLMNEDLFWSIIVPSHIPHFTIPDFKKALTFSVETENCLADRFLRGKVPFGSHKIDL